MQLGLNRINFSAVTLHFLLKGTHLQIKGSEKIPADSSTRQHRTALILPSASIYWDKGMSS